MIGRLRIEGLGFFLDDVLLGIYLDGVGSTWEALIGYTIDCLIRSYGHDMIGLCTIR